MSGIALAGPRGEVRLTLEITRAATGKKETVHMVGYTQLSPEELQARIADGSIQLEQEPAPCL